MLPKRVRLLGGNFGTCTSLMLGVVMRAVMLEQVIRFGLLQELALSYMLQEVPCSDVIHVVGKTWSASHASGHSGISL